MNLELVKYDDSVLTLPTILFDFDKPPIDPIELVQSMGDIMKTNNGIGLAAPQVGLSYSIFVINMDPEIKAFFNPAIVGYSDDLIALEEGCLSFPGMICKIKRPRHVRIRYQNELGETNTELFTGMTARVIQHEYDHLIGELFFNRANKYHRDLAMKRWKKKI